MPKTTSTRLNKLAIYEHNGCLVYQGGEQRELSETEELQLLLLLFKRNNKRLTSFVSQLAAIVKKANSN